jgi:hypothetical protein
MMLRRRKNKRSGTFLEWLREKSSGTIFERMREKRSGMLFERIKENWQYRAIALTLAIFSWYLVAGREKVQTWIEVPVELINLPQDLIIQQGLANRIEVLIRGTRGSVRSIKERQLAYTLNLSGLKRGENEIAFQSQFLPLPGAVEVIEIRPQRLSLSVDRRGTKQLPVKPVWKGQIDPDWEIVRTVTQPLVATVRGPEALIQGLTYVPTRTFEIELDESGTWQGNIPLSVDPTLESDPAQVVTRVFFKPKTNDLWVKIPLQVRGMDRARVDLPDASVRLHLEVPLYLLKRENWRDEIKAQLNIRRELQPGTHELVPEIVLPKWTQLLKMAPEKVQVTVSAK